MDITITGTGTPIPTPDRAGAGVLVRFGEVVLQFDAGPSTAMRLTAAGAFLPDLEAVFVTHHHSDHLLGLPAVMMTRWLDDLTFSVDPLRVVVPEGPAADIVAGMLDVWRDEIDMRRRHTSRTDDPFPRIERFTAGPDPQTVFSRAGVTVTSVAVSHEPVVPAVAYRVDSPSGSVVVSGDTTICETMENLCRDADVVVHEAFRTEAVAGLLSDPEAVAAYHSDTVALGAMAAATRIRHLVLTHLIPPPASTDDEQAFIADVRRGGYDGPVTVARDLTTVSLPASS